MNCITCQRPVTEHPRYFAQSHSTPPASDDLQGLYDDLIHILRYTSSLFQLMAGLHESPPHVQHGRTVENLGQLGQDLCEEAERRARRLLEAAAHRQARDEVGGTASAVQEPAIEEPPPAQQPRPLRLFPRGAFVLLVLTSLLLLFLIVWQKSTRDSRQQEIRPPQIVQEPPPPTSLSPPDTEVPPTSPPLPQKTEPIPSLTPPAPSTTVPPEPPATVPDSPSPALPPLAETDAPQTHSMSIPDSPSLPPPEPSQAPGSSQPEPASAAQPAHQLRIEAKELTWIRATIDEQEIKDILLQPGERIEWAAQRGFTLTVGNAGGVDLTLDGQQLPPLGGSGQVIRNLRLPPFQRGEKGRTVQAAEQ